MIKSISSLLIVFLEDNTPSKHEILSKNKNVVIHQLLLMALTFDVYRKSLSLYKGIRIWRQENIYLYMNTYLQNFFHKYIYMRKCFAVILSVKSM